MRKTYIENLRYKTDTRGIIWRSVIGQSCKFIYDDIIGYIKIVDAQYKNGKTKLIISYKNVKFEMKPQSVLKCMLGNVVHNIFVVNPYLCQFIVNDIQDIKKLTIYSDKFIDIKCNRCGTIRRRRVKDYFRYGASCRKCGDGISYPEKFMHSMLDQLDIDFIPQYMIDGFRFLYDFYVPSLNIILETDGGQHKNINNNWHRPGNDLIKTKICKHKKIKIIRIDCSVSDMEYIKNNIISNKEFCYFFDINKINWLLCDAEAQKGIVYQAADLYNHGYSVGDIAMKFKVSYTTIRRYLKKATKLSLCEYSKEKSLKERNIKAGESNRERVNPIKVFLGDEYIGLFRSPGEFSRLSLQLFDIFIPRQHIPAICNHEYGRRSIKGFRFEWADNNCCDLFQVTHKMSGYKYVYYAQYMEKYIVQIKKKYGGSFKNVEDAVRKAKHICDSLGMPYPDYPELDLQTTA